jgi:RNA-directed DNA polymerase
MATGDTRATDATTAQGPEAEQWLTIDWAKASREVRRLQHRIFRATQTGQWRTVRNLQKLLLRSQSNLALAVRQATQVNAGRNTPGVDGKVADTAEKRGKLLRHVRSTGAHRVHPVRRVYIPKANGKQRPLGVPTIEDRVRQCVVKTALEPSWEARFEPTSYGFRPGRSVHDAVSYLFLRLSSHAKGRWILDADIRGAFDHISHRYLLQRLGNFEPNEVTGLGEHRTGERK